MKDLIIIGAGGFGREVAQWVEDINRIEETWNILGFIDDNPDALDGFPSDYRVIGSVSGWQPAEDQYFALAIANSGVKEKIAGEFRNKGAKFASIIHPTATVGKHNKIGEGFIAYPGAVVTSNVTIGDFVTLITSGIGHDAVVGDYTTISGFCDITGGCHIGSHVFLGTHACIIPGRTVGDHVYICAGSVVMSDIQDNVKVMGNPARKINF